jgi:hypothetical protein
VLPAAIGHPGEDREQRQHSERRHRQQRVIVNLHHHGVRHLQTFTSTDIGSSAKLRCITAGQTAGQSLVAL